MSELTEMMDTFFNGRPSVTNTADARDAARYRRLRVLGAAVYGSLDLKQQTVARFTNLDDIVDTDIKAHPSRGEARK